METFLGKKKKEVAKTPQEEDILNWITLLGYGKQPQVVSESYVPMVATKKKDKKNDILDSRAFELLPSEVISLLEGNEAEYDEAILNFERVSNIAKTARDAGRLLSLAEKRVYYYWYHVREHFLQPDFVFFYVAPDGSIYRWVDTEIVVPYENVVSFGRYIRGKDELFQSWFAKSLFPEPPTTVAVSVTDQTHRCNIPVFVSVTEEPDVPFSVESEKDIRSYPLAGDPAPIDVYEDFVGNVSIPPVSGPDQVFGIRRKDGTMVKPLPDTEKRLTREDVNREYAKEPTEKGSMWIDGSLLDIFHRDFFPLTDDITLRSFEYLEPLLGRILDRVQYSAMRYALSANDDPAATTSTEAAEMWKEATDAETTLRKIVEETETTLSGIKWTAGDIDQAISNRIKALKDMRTLTKSFYERLLSSKKTDVLQFIEKAAAETASERAEIEKAIIESHSRAVENDPDLVSVEAIDVDQLLRDVVRKFDQ